MKKKKPRKKKRSFSAEFKAEALKVVRESGKPVSAVARDLDLTESSLRNWVKQAEVDAGRGAAETLTTDDKEEIRRLRRELRTVTMEREILKKATAFFAKENT